jgi:hypothetical protein
MGFVVICCVNLIRKANGVENRVEGGIKGGYVRNLLIISLMEWD